MKLIRTVTIGAIATLAASASAQLINGGFEQPNLGFHSVASGATYGNWTCDGPSDIEFVKAEFNASLSNLQFSAFEGQYWIDLCGVGAASGIHQDIANLTAGSTYRISFAQAGNVWGGNFNFAMDLLWNNQVVASFSSIHGGFDGTNMDWHARQADVVAQAGLNRLTFRSLTATSARGVAIDDVALTLIPAPGSLAAIAASGLLLARRRR